MQNSGWQEKFSIISSLLIVMQGPCRVIFRVCACATCRLPSFYCIYSIFFYFLRICACATCLLSFFYCIYLLIENLCLRNLSSSSSTSRCRNLSISLARIWGVCDLGLRVEGLGFSCRVRGLGISLYRLSTSPVYIAVYIACSGLCVV